MDRLFRRLLDAIEEIKLRYLLLGAISSVVFFSLLYFVGSSYGSGLRQGKDPVTDFGSCLYFSVVTFTSLGFGDLVPVGYGRLFASLEVAVGLTLFGLAVARLSSYKQSYLLNQLYARDAQGKLDQFALNLRALRTGCKILYDVAKGKGPSTQNTGKLIQEIRAEITRIRAFVSFESRNGYLLSGIPIGSITRLLKALSSLTSRMVDLSCVKETRVSQKHRASAEAIVRLTMTISGHLAGTKNVSIKAETKALESICRSALIQLESTSKIVGQRLELLEQERRKTLGFPKTPSSSHEDDV